MSDTVTRPAHETDESVYSNCDHELDEDTAAFLATNPTYYAQHAAWNFCGYVWFAEDLWHDQVWVYGSPVAVVTDPDLRLLIEAVNMEYGYA